MGLTYKIIHLIFVFLCITPLLFGSSIKDTELAQEEALASSNSTLQRSDLNFPTSPSVARRTETEPNDISGQANRLYPSAVPFVAITGAINPIGDDDWFSFTAPAGSTAWIYVDTGGVASGVSRDSIFTLFESDAVTPLEFDDDDGTGNGLDGTIESVLSSCVTGRLLIAGGTYFIRVQEFADSWTIDPYTLYLAITQNGSIAEIEPNDSAATSNPAGWRIGSISVANEFDFYSFTARAGSTVLLAADGDPERDLVEINPTINLISTDGTTNLLTIDSASGTPLGEMAAYVITVDGTYYALVSSPNTGTYQALILVADNNDVVNNGSFASGDFQGWTVAVSGPPFSPWAVVESGFTPWPPFVPASPQHGQTDALNGFDGAGPLTYTMYQDVTIPPGRRVTFRWRERIQWDFVPGGGSALARTYDVQVRDPGTGTVLRNLYSFTTGPETQNPTGDTGWVPHVANLTQFAGSTIRLYFLETIPENFTGPGQFEIDDISLSFAEPALYGSDVEGNLFKVDTLTGAGTQQGLMVSLFAPTSPPNGPTEIEFDPSTGRSFAQARDGGFHGHEFSIVDGSGLGAIVPDGGGYTGLEWVGPILYGTVIYGGGGASPSELRTIDPYTGASALIGPTGINAPISGLAYDAGIDTLYGIAGGPGPAGLYTINRATGAATLIGSTGIQAGSLEFAPNGVLYAGGGGADTGQIFIINPSTGAATPVGTTGFGTVTGLAAVGPYCPNLITIGTPSLADGMMGVPYSQTITASGGLAPHSFTVTNGALPNGLSLNSATGQISGIPTLQGTFSFQITAADANSCPSAPQSFTIYICLFCDDFEDGVLAADWTYVKPIWSESGGTLIGLPTGRKAEALAVPVFAGGCSVCTVRSMLQTAGGSFNKLWLLAWYVDKRNLVEVLVKEENDKIIVKQRLNKTIIAKGKAFVTINPNIPYDVAISYNGANFELFVNGVSVLVLPAAAVPNGTVGFRVKNTMGTFYDVSVD